jgi:hypothetical protein
MSMLTYLLIAFQFFPMPYDPVRANAIQERALVETAKQHEREHKARQELQKWRFEQKFNQLVEAIAKFSKQYNQGKGQVWPAREAEQLRKAMQELQTIAKSLGDSQPEREEAQK